MSRIADVIHKRARDGRARRGSSEALPEPAEASLRTVDDVGIPWLLQDESGPGPRRASEARTPAPVLTEARREVPPAPAQPERAPVPAVDDETMDLARRLFLRKDGEGVRRLLLTSVESPRGSADIALALALALAREPETTVCLADLNLDGGTLHERLGMEDAPGLSDAVHQRTPARAFARQVTGVAGLSLLTPGLQPRGLRPSLADAAISEVVRDLVQSFDYVVAHAAPAASADDAAVLGKCFDGVVLVLDAQATTPDAARSAAGALKAAGARVVGSVVHNRIAAPGRER